MGPGHASRMAGPSRRQRTGLSTHRKAPVTIVVAGGLAIGEEDLPAQYCTGMKVVATPRAKNVNPMVITTIIATQNRIAIIIIMSGRFTFPPQG